MNVQAAAPVLQCSDLAKGRAFYGSTLGLKEISADDHEVVFRVGTDGELILNPVSEVVTTGRTAASFTVADLRDTAAALRQRGVSFLDYDEPGLETVDGIHDDGECLTAWTQDPDGNIVCLCSVIAATAVSP